ncbi:Ricin-type beta-trefoil lectin domain-containing protein [Lentzea xinjiangensis]|uniref:Ricin-type beta-trefoil lectin domain-containing protein n=1 Tax=Lentzea xinjiangensis TaxID=402600 RepID=A0A1H9IBQ3_9PSEU|nr:RICIN domain-containing protein [Lentzea xinjiangensis]SEQ71968.1 Ricin-type beta-trefoil lectin domain-containing protein [Lentzea xinjiangensis]
MTPFLRKIALLASLALVSGGLLVTSSTSAGAQAGFQILSRHNNRCMTAATEHEGAGVIMVDCQGAATQRWYWDGLRLRNVSTGKCLSAAWGNGENGGALQMFGCWADNNAFQLFYRPASHDYEVGRMRSWLGGNRCVEISGSNWWSGATVQLWDCHTGANHYWYQV